MAFEYSAAAHLSCLRRDGGKGGAILRGLFQGGEFRVSAVLPLLRRAIALCRGWRGGTEMHPLHQEAPAFTQARAALRYDETAKRMILPLKYADHTEAVNGLAELMRRPGEQLLQAANLLVPVPLHASRLRARRFNQAALLAIQLARLTGRPLGLDTLIRRRETAPLEGLGLAARRAQLEGAIIVRPEAQLQDKRVLLIDDVMTSGTTANECARVLREAGARRVDVLTAARVADPRFEAIAVA